jgi:hypothetical protein
VLLDGHDAGPRADADRSHLAAGTPVVGGPPVAALPRAVIVEALAAYARDGHLVVPGLLGESDCAELRAAADALGAGPGAAVGPVMNPHRLHPRFFRSLCDPRLVGILEALLGEPVSGLQTQYFPCVPGTPGFATHQDNHYVEAERDSFASAWIALDDTRADNGALFVHPGSHREPLLPVAALPSASPHATQAFNALRQHVPVPPGYRMLTLEMPRGAVVFLHGHLLHGSHDNRSAYARPALLMTYIRRGAAFRSGDSARRTEIDVHGGESR